MIIAISIYPYASPSVHPSIRPTLTLPYDTVVIIVWPPTMIDYDSLVPDNHRLPSTACGDFIFKHLNQSSRLKKLLSKVSVGGT